MNNNMITEDYVSFETAKLLKEKRFHVSDISMLVGNDNHPFISGNSGYEFLLQKGQEVYPAPTLQMAMKWLREIHGIFTIVQPNFQPDCIKFDAYILPYHPDKTPNAAISMAMCEDTYEAVCDEAIKYCLENLI